MIQLKTVICSALIASSLVVSQAAISEGKVDAKVTELLKSRLAGVAIAEASTTPVDDIYQTRFGNKFAYLTGDGRYIFIGDMIDLETQVNLTEVSRRGIAKDAIDAVDIKDLAVFPATTETKAVLNVFTDTSCPYCKKLHEEVPELQKAGIEVRYLPFPRGGAKGPGYQSLKQVWCGKDKAKAMDIAKDVQNGDLPSAECEASKMVDRGYELGNQVGVTGTPALFTETGRKFDGYVPYAQLIPMILSEGSQN